MFDFFIIRTITITLFIYLSIYKAKLVITIMSEILNLFKPNWKSVLILQISHMSSLINKILLVVWNEREFKKLNNIYCQKGYFQFNINECYISSLLLKFVWVFNFLKTCSRELLTLYIKMCANGTCWPLFFSPKYWYFQLCNLVLSNMYLLRPYQRGNL